MNNLQLLLNNAGVEHISAINRTQTQWQSFYQTNDALFDKVCQQKPDTAPLLHALGILTKAHLASMQTCQQQQHSAKVMHKVFTDTVGSQHGQQFHLLAEQQLHFHTHLWLFLQGRLNMDFSLADDYALQTAQQLHGAQDNNMADYQHQHVLRSELLASFYQGQQCYRQTLPWWQRLFSR